MTLRLESNAAELAPHLRGIVEQFNAASRQSRTSMARAVGSLMVGRITDRIKNQTLLDGSAMPKSKAAARRGGQTLVQTGRLIKRYAFKASGDSVALGNNLAYAAPLHFGTAARDLVGNGKKLKFKIGGRFIFRKRVHIPAMPPRPVLGVNAADENEIGATLKRMIASNFKQL